MTEIVKTLDIYFPYDLSEIIEEYQQDWIQKLSFEQKELFNFAINVDEKLVTKYYTIVEVNLSPNVVIPFLTDLGYYVSRKGDPNYCISLFPFNDEEYSMYPKRSRIHQYLKMKVTDFISLVEESSLPNRIHYSYLYSKGIDYSIQGWENIISLFSKAISNELKKKGIKAIFDEENQWLTIEKETITYSHSWIKDYKFYKKRKLE